MRIDILTLFPEMVEAVLGTSMLRIASDKGIVRYEVHDFRRFGLGKHHRVDDRPFGGGPGMVLKPEPIVACLEDLLGDEPEDGVAILATSPQGEVFDQRMAEELSARERLVILAGHYEGYDQRIFELLPIREVSIGDYVLTQGELPALVLVDAVVRLRPGVLGDEESVRHESFNEDRLDHPHYTRPVDYRGLVVPEVLRSGDHARIEAWRREQALEKTRRVRPDLLDEPDRNRRRQEPS